MSASAIKKILKTTDKTMTKALRPCAGKRGISATESLVRSKPPDALGNGRIEIG